MPEHTKGKLIQFDPTVKPKKPAPKPPEQPAISWTVQGFSDGSFKQPVAIGTAALDGDVLSAVAQMLSSNLGITAILVLKE